MPYNTDTNTLAIAIFAFVMLVATFALNYISVIG